MSPTTVFPLLGWWLLQRTLRRTSCPESCPENNLSELRCVYTFPDGWGVGNKEPFVERGRKQNDEYQE